jgi:hypothetical protein
MNEKKFSTYEEIYKLTINGILETHKIAADILFSNGQT